MSFNKTRWILFLWSLLTLLLAAGATAIPGEPAQELAPPTTDTTVFEQLLDHYEAVRQTLSVDRTEGIAHHGQEMSTLLEELQAEWSAERAGVSPEQADEVRKLLPELTLAATQLAGAESIDTARDAFYSLSKPMVRFRKATNGDKPAVAYCPMARRSWLQPEGDLGNPYYGQSMLRCGEVVDG